MDRRSDESRESRGSSDSSALPLSRRVADDDGDLLRRVETVRHQHGQVLNDVAFVETLGRRGTRHAIRSGSGWKRKKEKRGFSLYSRHNSGVEQTREWLVVGHVSCTVLDLAKLLSPSVESDLNSVMKGLYRSAFIYGSVVHCSRTRRSRSVSSTTSNSAVPVGPLLVKTCSFVHASMLSSKNDQLCFAEHLRPSQHGGFTVAICSMPEHELAAGTASSNIVREIHPFSILWSVEPSGRQLESPVRVIYHSCLNEVVGSKEEIRKQSRHAVACMEALAKGITKRLGPLAVASKRRVRLGTDPQTLSIGSAGGVVAPAPRGHRNTHCIVCTRHLFGLFQSIVWRRCDLCAYLVCENCCSAQRLPPRAALRVCSRCMDSREFREYSSALRESPPPRRHTISDPGSGRGGPVLEDIESESDSSDDRTESDHGGRALKYTSSFRSDGPGEFSI